MLALHKSLVLGATILGAAAFAIAVVACGARSSLDMSSSGEGGGGTATSTTIQTSTVTSTTSGQTCTSLDVHEPAIFIGPSIVQRKPDIGLEGNGKMLVSLVSDPMFLSTTTFDPSAAWPPEDLAWNTLAGNVVDFVMGPGVDGPVGVVDTFDEGPTLLTTIDPPVPAHEAFVEGGERLFATGIADRYLYGAINHTPGFYDVLAIGSYQPSSLAQVEPPSDCATSEMSASAVPSGQGFLAAFATSGSNTCGTRPVAPANILTVGRYDSPTRPGSFLSFSVAQQTPSSEPYRRVLLSPTVSGGWLMTQTDGSTSRTPPPLMAGEVDTAGHQIRPMIPVSPSGTNIFGAAIATIGNGAVVGWVDLDDPGGATLTVEVLNPDGSVGAQTSRTLDGVVAADILHLAVSPDQRSVYAVVGGSQTVDKVILARFDCFLGT